MTILHPFDLHATINSGQTFHWHPFRNGWLGTIGDSAVYLEQTPDGLRITPEEMTSHVIHYFALDHDIPAIQQTFPQDDRPLREAIAYSPGLRILRQPLWECLATFITSSLKQVPHIRQISLRLRERFGQPLAPLFPDAPLLHAYPTAAALVHAGETALRDCGLGYRAAFLHRAATDISQGNIDLTLLPKLNDTDARAHLMKLHGVGEKISNCVLLFACERLAAIPIDVWIERVLRQLYFSRKRNVTAPRIRHFANTHFGPHAGYAQQYLFHHARLTKLKETKKPS